MDSLDRLLERLIDERASAGAAFQLAESRDPRALVGLTSALKNDHPVIRNSALLGLAEKRDSSAIPAIVELLNDPEVYVRASAARLLELYMKKDTPQRVKMSRLKGVSTVRDQ